MRTGDVEVTIDGLPFGQDAVTGVSISYGFNSVPVASLQLDAPHINEEYGGVLLCDPDTYKKRDKLVNISIKAKTGCLNFTGYFDGLNIVQTPGGYEYTAIIKSKFQRLMEIFPKIPGLWPGSVNIFRVPKALKVQFGNTDVLYTTFRDGKSESIETNIPIGVFVKKLFRLLVKTQIDWQITTNVTKDIQKMVNVIMSNNYKKNLQAALPLLDAINTTAIEGCELKANACAEGLLDLVLAEQANLWDLMVSAYKEMGCILVPANDTLFIVPEAGFLKIKNEHAAFQQEATSINHAFPADYNSLMINDNGYINLKYCFMAPVLDGLTHALTEASPASLHMLGVYPPEGEDSEIPDDGSCGVLIGRSPGFLFNALSYSYTITADEVQPPLSNPGTPHAPIRTIDSPEAAKEKREDHQKKMEARREMQQKALDDWAKARFLQAKYAERGGSFNTQFHPKWVPGSTGSLYARLPGLFFNFFVTGVHHSISLSAPKTGTAITQVSFGSTRYSGNPGGVPGVEKDEFYNYATTDMENFQSQWVHNTQA